MKKKENLNHDKGVDYMSTVIAQKWGNSLGIRIPKEAADKIGIDQGTELELSVSSQQGIITIKPKKVKKEYSLEELLSRITAENRHSEIELGKEGRELI